MVPNYNKSVLITGASGLLGMTLNNFLSNYFNVIPTHKFTTNSADSLDITDKKSVKEMLFTLNPNYIINCAAITDVDKCEIDRETAYNVNVNGLKNIIKYSKKNT